MVRKLKATTMAQTLTLGRLSDSSPPHRMRLRLQQLSRQLRQGSLGKPCPDTL
ncbi:hypothetical protein H6G89_29940 [Oscillatoria sp. FACHB-1407]|uniref:hypothetical protein n=1 Tax=Oscillatoria sp. FACHB-1407 TaxID=2692847 RepID=UPI001684EDA2|nr:hypothetical protein [Oscillatoria sp. FACHB-1407]MBD2465235.1 hypothetical protein [Oscillatoria sp. FACHB-1407]